MEWAANEVEERLVSNLIPYERNPRIHPASQIHELASSINEWGWTVPILIDENENVIAGHGRLYAAKELGIETVPCVIASGWTDQQKKAYVIADNKLQEGSDWNYSAMASELRDLIDGGFSVELTGISDAELQIFSGSESSEEFTFSLDTSEISKTPPASDQTPRKSDEGYVEFALVMQEDNKRQLLEKLNQIKNEHGVHTHEDALMIAIR